MRSDKELEETAALLDRVEKEGSEKAINWLRCAFFTHRETIRRLHEDIKDLRCLASAYIIGPLTVKQAQILRVCRICRGETGAPFTLNYGEEYAHPKCLDRERETNSSQVLPVFPTLTGEF